eukprot:5853814-Pyramimonas_sp.AAC.1
MAVTDLLSTSQVQGLAVADRHGANRVQDQRSDPMPSISHVGRSCVPSSKAEGPQLHVCRHVDVVRHGLSWLLITAMPVATAAGAHPAARLRARPPLQEAPLPWSLC